MEIQRSILTDLERWRDSRFRKPLVLQGARQVGKSWVLKQFGTECFDHCLYVNFDTHPELKADFVRTKDPARLIKQLEMSFGQKVVPGKTLIVLDEIQECNEALNSLKYFCEDCPEVPVVCAGSLLGVALNRSEASFPVGKVDFMTMYPVSFLEFVTALYPHLSAPLMGVDLQNPVPELIHSQLLDAYRVHLALGGMPEAVSRWGETMDWTVTDEVLRGVMLSYSLDFSKHIDHKDIPRVFQVWNTIQDQLARENRKFRYGDIQTGARAREYEGAVEWLCLSGIVHRLNAVETPRLPLSAYQKSGAFKLYLADVGLLRSKFRLDATDSIRGNRLLTEFKGVLSENYVLQSLVRQWGTVPCFWTSGNTAEVEFLLQHGSSIIPVEVKAGDNVKAKSLALYRKTYSPEVAVRFSTKNIRRDNDLWNLPLYLADRLRELLDVSLDESSMLK
ncbi:MAG: ATP-binding protein [Bacteroidales bacterium]|nr:ATP-binding protein [Bacteroidales bacterium]MDD4670881.1 ATP-binding protein [Bacteroidales bacterium]